MLETAAVRVPVTETDGPRVAVPPDPIPELNAIDPHDVGSRNPEV